MPATELVHGAHAEPCDVPVDFFAQQGNGMLTTRRPPTAAAYMKGWPAKQAEPSARIGIPQARLAKGRHIGLQRAYLKKAFNMKEPRGCIRRRGTETPCAMRKLLRAATWAGEKVRSPAAPGVAAESISMNTALADQLPEALGVLCPFAAKLAGVSGSATLPIDTIRSFIAGVFSTRLTSALTRWTTPCSAPAGA
jgi:hypothetical protein